MARCGTTSAYSAGCRCDDCRAAHRQYAAERRKKGTAPKHGIVSGYINHGCRCDLCRAAGKRHNDAAREAREGKEPVAHGWSGYAHFGCRCEVCRDAATGRVGAEERKKQYERVQGESRIAATHHYQPWTGPELELIARDDLTQREMAAMLGRTHAAVRNMRAKVLADPRKIKLAGLPTTGE